MYINSITSCMSFALILNHPLCRLISGVGCGGGLARWLKKKIPSTKMSRSCMRLWGTKHTWRMRSRPGSGPLGTPFHHLSKQACRARITKTTFTLPPYQHVPLGFFFFFFEDYTFLCDSFLGKSSVSIDITQGSFRVLRTCHYCWQASLCTQ